MFSQVESSSLLSVQHGYRFRLQDSLPGQEEQVLQRKSLSFRSRNVGLCELFVDERACRGLQDG
jgi:hypothetical protein